jgi:hypothetical protein
MAGLCSVCGHAVAAHGHDCSVCVLLEDMAIVLLGLEECTICLALCKPESRADHERQHSTNSNRPMAEQRQRWADAQGMG